MTTITYDYFKRLENAGFTPAQVEVLMLPTAEFATKSELDRVEKELTTKIEDAETRLEKRMDYRFDLVDKRFDLMEEQLASLRNLIKWLIGVAIAIIPSISAWFTWISHLVVR